MAMAKTDGKSEEMLGLDLEHELPEADGDEGTNGGRPSGEAASGAGSALETELQKVKAERDTLLDRLARMQAEFENARRRAEDQGQVRAVVRRFAIGVVAESLPSPGWEKVVRRTGCGITPPTV